MQQNPIVQAHLAYPLTKISASTALQLMAEHTPSDKMQIINFHPGLLFNPTWGAMGFAKEQLPFDSGTFSLMDCHSTTSTMDALT
jgi:hypothetical protein